MAACLTFVFLGLVEFAYVNVLTRAERKGSTNKQNGLKVVDATTKTNKSKTVSNLYRCIKCDIYTLNIETPTFYKA